MAPRFGNALNTLSAAGGYMPQAQDQWLQVQARQRALADAQRQDAARQAYFQSLTTPDMAALPQQGQGSGFTMPATAAGPSAGPSPMMPPMQQQQQQPMAPPSMQPPTAGGGGPSMQPGPGPQQPMPQGRPPMMPQGAAPSPPAATQSPAMQVPSLPDPMVRLRQMAQSLARANPQLAGTPEGQLTLAAALDQQINTLKGLAPDDRATLQAEVQIMKIQATSDAAIQKAQNATDIANIRAASAQQVADVRAAAMNYGADRRADTSGQNRLASMERLKYSQDRIDQRAAQASGSRADAKAKAAQYKQIMAQRAQMKDAISGAGGIASPEQQKQLDALDQKAVQFWSANNWLPRPSELDRAGPDEAPGGGNAPPAAAPAPAAVAPGAGGGGALPTDLPAAQGLDDGTVAKDGSGKVVAVVKGGQWTAPGQ